MIPTTNRLIFAMTLVFVWINMATSQVVKTDSANVYDEIKAAQLGGKFQKIQSIGHEIFKKHGESYERYGSPIGILVGFELGISKKDNGSEHISAIKPLFETQSKRSFGREIGIFKNTTAPFEESDLVNQGKYTIQINRVVKSSVTRTLLIQAKPGYAVGKVRIKPGYQIEGMEIVFARIKGNVLDPYDTYKSPWIGTFADEDDSLLITSEGRLIVGLHGVVMDIQKVEAWVISLGFYCFDAPPPVPEKPKLQDTERIFLIPVTPTEKTDVSNKSNEDEKAFTSKAVEPQISGSRSLDPANSTTNQMPSPIVIGIATTLLFGAVLWFVSKSRDEKSD